MPDESGELTAEEGEAIEKTARALVILLHRKTGGNPYAATTVLLTTVSRLIEDMDDETRAGVTLIVRAYMEGFEAFLAKKGQTQ